MSSRAVCLHRAFPALWWHTSSRSLFVSKPGTKCGEFFLNEILPARASPQEVVKVCSYTNSCVYDVRSRRWLRPWNNGTRVDASLFEKRLKSARAMTLCSCGGARALVYEQWVDLRTSGKLGKQSGEIHVQSLHFEGCELWIAGTVTANFKCKACLLIYM